MNDKQAMEQREIKFRLHNKDGIIIGYEFHRKNEFGCYQIYQVSLRGDWINGYEEKNVREGYFIAATYKVQYTGLKDKNGKEIYEGDIVKHAGWLCEVVYGVEGACFSLVTKNNETDLSLISSFTCDYIKVIGNVFENPELLKSKTNE